jgi:hypothetical protein
MADLGDENQQKSWNKENSNLDNSDSDSDESYFSCESDENQLQDDTSLKDDVNYKESSSSSVVQKFQKESQATSNDKDKKILPPVNEAFSHDDESPKEDESANRSIMAQFGKFIKQGAYGMFGVKPSEVKTLEERIKALMFDDNNIPVIISFQPDLFQKALHDILKRKYYTDDVIQSVVDFIVSNMPLQQQIHEDFPFYLILSFLLESKMSQKFTVFSFNCRKRFEGLDYKSKCAVILKFYRQKQLCSILCYKPVNGILKKRWLNLDKLENQK